MRWSDLKTGVNRKAHQSRFTTDGLTRLLNTIGIRSESVSASTPDGAIGAAYDSVPRQCKPFIYSYLGQSEVGLRDEGAAKLYSGYQGTAGVSLLWSNQGGGAAVGHTNGSLLKSRRNSEFLRPQSFDKGLHKNDPNQHPKR